MQRPHARALCGLQYLVLYKKDKLVQSHMYHGNVEQSHKVVTIRSHPVLWQFAGLDEKLHEYITKDYCFNYVRLSQTSRGIERNKEKQFLSETLSELSCSRHRGMIFLQGDTNCFNTACSRTLEQSRQVR